MKKNKLPDSEFQQKWNEIRNKRLREKRAQENHSMFTTLSVVGIAIGGGLGFRLGGAVAVTVGFALGFALIGAAIDWFQYHRTAKTESTHTALPSTEVPPKDT